MARGRMISKEISLDEKVDALSDDTARLLFTWMIPHLDSEGRMYGEAQVFKSIVAPRRNYTIKKVEKTLVEMEKLGLIERYSFNGNVYIYKPNFEKHQLGLRKEKEAQSKIPPKTPDLGRTKDGLTHLQVEEEIKVKVEEEIKVKEEVKEERKSPQQKEIEFNEYVEELRSEYSDIKDFDNQLKKFRLYWSEGTRKLVRPKTALRNWLDKAREYKQERSGDGAHRGNPKKLPDRKSYTKPEDLR